MKQLTFMSMSRLAAILILLALSAGATLAQDDVTRPEGWDDYSHGNDTEPVYEAVFPQAAVNTVTITIEPDTWQAMLDNMTELYGEFGQGAGGRILEFPEGLEPGQPPEGLALPEGFEPGQPPEDFEPPAGTERGFGGVPGQGENPIWVAVDLEFNGRTWTNVGMRFKGNSSLSGAWRDGSYKLGFKLDFDEFEAEYPEINNQRFYGFKQLSFSSNWNDPSYLREKVAADIFREAGVPAAQTAFYAVYVDYGEGPEYFGLYTAVEEIEDTVIQTQFENDNGNVYKPEGQGATFAEGSFSEDSFDKETNQEEADYSDILALFDALHAGTRISDPEAWRERLESVFDVKRFLRFLAVNSLIQNWDTYGAMPHNYYLYHDPSTGLLTWIPWDHNFALTVEGGGLFGRARVPAPANAGNVQGPNNLRGPGSFGGGGNTALGLADIGDNWPLIRYLMDDPVYKALYDQYVEETANGAFEPTKMEATYTALRDLIAPYVELETERTETSAFSNEAQSFEEAVDALIQHVSERYAAAQAYLGTEATAK